MLNIQVIASGSGGNAYKIDDGKTPPLLIECGLPFKQLQKALDFKVNSLGGVLVSHSHKDHCKGIQGFIDSGIDCYLYHDTADQLNLSGHRIKEVNGEFQVGGWLIKTFRIVHDVEGIGFCMGNQAGDRLLYVSDTAYIRERFTGLTHLLIECNYSRDILEENIKSGAVPEEMKRRLIKTHLSLEHVKDFLRANDLRQVKEIHLIHVSENNGDKQLFKNEIQKSTGKQIFIY